MSIKRFLTQGACVAALGASMFIAGCSGSSTAAAPTATPTFTPSPTPIAVPAPQTGFSTYKSTDGAYGFNYPTAWQETATTASGVNLVIVTNQKDTFVVFPLNAKVPASSYGDLLKSFAQGSGGTNVKIGATTQTVTLGSNSWTVLSGSLTLSKVNYDAAVFGTDHGPYTTLLIALAPHATFDADGTNYFQPMVTSFTFLK